MRHLILIACTAALTGCAAKISLTVTDTVVGTPNQATVSVDPNTAAVFPPVELRVGSRQYAATPAPTNLGLRVPGEYMADARIGFKRLFSGQLEQAIDQRVFRVFEPDGCFSFQDPQVPNLGFSGSTQAWSNGGFKNVVGDAEVAAPQSRRPSIDWDRDSDGLPLGPVPQGVLRLVARPSDQPPVDAPLPWYFDAISPVLEPYPAWRGVNGFSYSVRGIAAAHTQLRVQAILRVRKPDGSEALFAEGTAASRVFRPVTAHYQSHTSPIPLPPGHVVLEARLRFHGTPGQPSQNLLVFVDSVCPLP